MKKFLISSLITAGTLTVNKAVSDKCTVAIIGKFGSKIPWSSNKVYEMIKLGLFTCEIIGLCMYVMEVSEKLEMTERDLEGEMLLNYMEEYNN